MKRLYIALLCSLTYTFSSADTTKANIDILATGGTIAGAASSQTSTTYTAGKLSAEQLLASVDGLNKLANIQYSQVYSKDSADVTLQDWLNLANKVQLAVDDKNIDGVVVTHGTDTLEETAYFLDLVIKTKKPIVLVGSMRPATSMSADGPLNLYNAVAVAANKTSSKRGVLVSLNEDIFNARGVTKTNTTAVHTFNDPNFGAIGLVEMGNVKYYLNSNRSNTSDTPFSVNKNTELPNVAIVYEYAGVDTNMLDNILNTPNLQGIVIAGVGSGNIPSYESDFLIKARNKGIVIVRSSRTGSGEVSYDYNNLDTKYGLIAGDNLNPQKARILLMLSLLKTKDIKKIQEYFYTY